MIKEYQITKYEIDVEKLVATLQQLNNRLGCIENRLNDLVPPDIKKTSDELMTRKEVAQHFKINIATVRNWSIQGILKKYGVGDRVYFKRSEVESLPKQLNE
ncbi:MAG: helix-turn-helix domain-containing protein [Crocinitomicaceae bacterium]|nr:helix-turn-helix domain-containing protein [Crocinitomicaceae bacterium]MDG1776065.1 helix-turn-helix domain-containing protein [Crocinitomicaceae bacterium]